MRKCPLSESTNWETIYESKSDKIMTGDQRIGPGRLAKIINIDTGIVANKFPFSKDELELLYGEKYELNTLNKEEHIFYYKNRNISRSQVFFEWIDPHLPKNFESIVEVGCGEGNLLKRFNDKYRDKTIIGYDGSNRAVEIAQKKGLNVKQKLILGDEQFPQSDVILAINVAEHIEDINMFILLLKKALTKNGRLIFCIPIQDYGGYDIFFAEHVWHFTSDHFANILKKTGLNIIYTDYNHKINHGIGLFVCSIEYSDKSFRANYSDIILNNFNYWKRKFNEIDDFFIKETFSNVAVFGASEVFTLYLTFTLLKNQNIIACIDETKTGTIKHGIAVHNLNWLNQNHPDIILLATNNKYYNIIRQKLVKYNIRIKEF